MIRTEVHAMGTLVDVLVWDGNEEELRSFTPDEIYGVDENGVMRTGHLHMDLLELPRYLRIGDILVRPAGRNDISPLHIFRDTWWAQSLGLL